jgi:hypothetical protein
MTATSAARARLPSFAGHRPKRRAVYDRLEHQQVDLAEAPGGHLSTSQRAQALAAVITKFERGPTRPV